MRFAAALVLTTLLGACAHPIAIAPERRTIVELPGPKIPATLGLHIPKEDLDLEVTTSGGGGDSVRYFPYRDLEAALALALSNVFEKVVVLREALAADRQRAEGLSLSMRPRLTTASGSSSAFTWPPTFFIVSLSAPFMNPDGKLVALVQESGAGNATYGEFIGARGLAGERAAADMLNKLQSRIFATPELAGPLTRPMPVKPAQSPAELPPTTPGASK